MAGERNIYTVVCTQEVDEALCTLGLIRDQLKFEYAFESQLKARRVRADEKLNLISEPVPVEFLDVNE